MDEIVIDIPRERPFSAVADLVLGGVAARHEMTLDVLDDLQLALASLLDHGDDDGQIQVVLRVAPDAIEASVGPVGDATASELGQPADDRLGLRRLLDTVVDEVSVSEHEGGSWVSLRKGYALAGADG